MKGEPTKADMLQHLTCWLCKGVYRDAHTINECMCTCNHKLTYFLPDCKGCIYKFFTEVANRNKCPQCQTELGGKPIETLVKDITLQNIVDWLIPDFKDRDDKLKSQLLKELNEKRALKGSLKPQKRAVSSSKGEEDAKMEGEKVKTADINFEFKLLVFADEDLYLRMNELPKKLKYANKNKTILTVKKHISSYLNEPIDNIEILCKNFPVADSHSLEYIRKTKWQHRGTMILMYKRKKRIIGNQAK